MASSEHLRSRTQVAGDRHGVPVDGDDLGVGELAYDISISSYVLPWLSVTKRAENCG